jgi:serine protease Do
MSAFKSLKLALVFSIAGSALNAEPGKFWTELSNGAAPLVGLPNLGPIIDQVDHTIVNIATTAEPKVDPRRRQQQPQGDPFSNPEDFFERFFNMPFGERQRQPRRSLGSGFIISKDGHIVTNNHVIDGADKIEVTLFSNDNSNRRRKEGEKFTAKLIGRDPATDLALLKIDVKRDLPFVPLGDSSRLKKGDWVLAFGNPFGLDHSVSLGIVSATGREISPNENRRFDDFIQTDAAINFGNSGGPLINLRGEVIGVNTAISAQGSGIGFAVPVNILKEVISQLRSSGSVARGYLGVMIQDVSEDIKEAMGLKEASGVLVNDIPPTGPASKSTLQRGDVIVKINAQPIDDSRTLQKTVAAMKPGTKVTIEVIRDKKAVQVPVTIGSLGEDQAAQDKAAPESGKADLLGLMVQMAPDGSGVMVADIADGSSAADSGVMPGDLIRSVNKRPVKSVKDYQDAVKGLKPGQRVLLDLDRRGMKLFLAFQLKQM